MQLLNEEIRKAFPMLGDTDGEGKAARIVAKFFDPCGSWTWYATEFDGSDLFYGFVDGTVGELGYFSLRELTAIKGSFGIGIERDLHYHGHTLGEVMP